MVSEIFPLRTRGKGISLAVLTNFGSNAIVTFSFSPLKVFGCLLQILVTSKASFTQFTSVVVNVFQFCRNCWAEKTFSFFSGQLLWHHFCSLCLSSQKLKDWAWRTSRPKSWSESSKMQPTLVKLPLFPWSLPTTVTQPIDLLYISREFPHSPREEISFFLITSRFQ